MLRKALIVTADRDGAIENAAIGWHIRLPQAGRREWEEFIAWLEADPRHRAAYEAIAEIDSDVDAAKLTDYAPHPIQAANENDSTSNRRWFIAGALGAGAAAALFLASLPAIFANHQYQVSTAPGQQRQVRLPDGTSIALNGGTLLVLDERNPRRATLVRGEAMFAVRHDSNHPFSVVVGDSLIEDTGTVFNVIADGPEQVVAVKEGGVIYEAGGEAIKLGPGQMLRSSAGSPGLLIARQPPNAIGSWRAGRLDYDQATFGRIARDLSRNLGVPVSVDPSIAERRFTGTIELDRNPARMTALLESLLGVDIRQHGTSWRMLPLSR